MKNVTLKKRMVSIAMVLLMVATCVFGDVPLSALAATEVSGGTMQPHANAGSNTGIHFTLAENAAPYLTDWTLEYMPTSADAIKIVRGGVTYNTANTGAGTLVKYSATEYYLKFDTWMNSNHPLQDGDIVIVDGSFTKDDCTIIIDTTYILYSGGTFTFSTTMPGEESVLSAGYMSQDTNNPSPNLENGSFYFTMEANESILYNDWNIRYIPTTADAIKRIRNEVTTNVGNTGGETLVKYSETGWYVEGWTIGTHSDPWQAGDILVVDGTFANASNGVEFVIEKTYILYDGTSLKFSKVWPLTVELGNMQAHPTNTAPSVGESASGDFHFTLADSEYVPVSDAGYYPMAANTIQRIRNGATTDATNLAAQTFVKYSSTEWRVPGWTIGTQYNQDYTWQDGDILLIEGNFNSAQDGSGVTFHISTTYVYYKDGVLTFSTTMPDVSDEISAGYMKEHSDKTVNTGDNEDGFYFTMDANSVPYDDWNILYKPTSADAVKLIRDGVTTDVAITTQDLIVKYSETEYYFKIAAWTLSNVRPLRDGDILVIDGSFSNESNGTTFSIDKTYVMYYNNELIFSTTMPEIPEEIVIGPMQEHTNGYNENGIFFSTEANEFIPSGVYYNPVTEGTMVRIRDGVEEEIGHSGRETLYKNSETEWILQGWTIGGIDNMQDGDILKIDGQFKNETNGVTFTMETSYIVYSGGKMLFYDILPKTVNADNIVAEVTDNGKINVNMNISISYSDLDTTDEVAAFLNGAKLNGVTLQSLVDAGSISVYFEENAGNTLYPTTMTVEIASDYYKTISDFAISFESMDYTNGTVNYTGGSDIVARWIEVDGKAGLTTTDLIHLLRDVSGDAYQISADINCDGQNDRTDSFWIRRMLLGETVEEIDGILKEGISSDAGAELTIGVWNGSYHAFGKKDLNILDAAGINLLIGVDEQWTGGMNGVLDKASAVGIDVIADFRNWDSSTIPEWSSHDALRGFLMKDEPCATDASALSTTKETFDKTTLAEKEFYINLLPSAASITSLYGSAYDNSFGQWFVDYKSKYVDKFTGLGLDTLAFDSYGLLDDNTYLRPTFYENFEILANIAKEKNMAFQYTLCSSAHSTTDATFAMPTEETLRWQMALGLTFGARELVHYTYTSSDSGYSTMVEYDTWKTTGIYDDVKKVNQEFLSWDDIYLNYTWQATMKYDVGTTNTALSNMTGATYTGTAMIDFENTEDMMTGWFKDAAGNEAFMITNAGQVGSVLSSNENKASFTMTAGEVTITFAEGYERAAVIREGNTIVYLLEDDNTVTLPVDAYEGIFVIPLD